MSLRFSQNQEKVGRVGVPLAILVHSYRTCRSRHTVATGRPTKWMCTGPKNDQGGFETRPYVFRAVGRESETDPAFHIFSKQRRGTIRF